LPDRVTERRPGALSWFYLAPRPITSFEQQWQANRIVLKSIDPAGVEQLRIVVASMAGYGTRIVANVKNLEALGGGAPMVYVRAYVDVCARVIANAGTGSLG
jgi:hypothetical protein